MSRKPKLITRAEHAAVERLYKPLQGTCTSLEDGMESEQIAEIIAEVTNHVTAITGDRITALESRIVKLEERIALTEGRVKGIIETLKRQKDAR